MRILIFRSGAFGDVVIITPVIRHLYSQGHKLVVVTSARGLQVLKNNPHIEELVAHKEDTPIDKLSDYLDYLRRRYKCEKVIDFSESVEVSLSQHPRSPNYKLSKQERFTRFNRNFYEYSFEHAGENWRINFQDSHVNLKPELFFEESELVKARTHLKSGFNILLGLSGSGSNKTWVWSQDLAYKIIQNYPDIHIITVGDEKCQLIEPEHERITNLAGKISMREAMCLTGLVQLVIAPDTGIIHAAGCYDTQKILIVGHNTKECISKHFTNCHTVEADPVKAPCAPCLYLIYDHKLQCVIDEDTGGSICMSKGIELERVYKVFEGIYAQSK